MASTAASPCSWSTTVWVPATVAVSAAMKFAGSGWSDGSDLAVVTTVARLPADGRRPPRPCLSSRRSRGLAGRRIHAVHLCDDDIAVAISLVQRRTVCGRLLTGTREPLKPVAQQRG